jgi:hypothetical protein
MTFDKQGVLRNHHLRILEFDVEDDNIRSVLNSLISLIRLSEDKCDKATLSARPGGVHDDYAEHVYEQEGANIEELIGAVLLMLQARIRRVKRSSKKAGIKDDLVLKDSANKHESHAFSLVEIVWDLANYYKHRDDWNSAVWDDEGKTSKLSVETRKSVERVGVERGGTANLRTALERLSTSHYSQSAQSLNEGIQSWAKRMLQMANELP